MSHSDTNATAPADRSDDEQGARSAQSFSLRVAYDAQAFLSANGGTGKGAQLKNLLGPYSESFLGFATRGKNHFNRPLVQGGLSGYQLWQQISLPYLLHKWRVDVFLAPYNIAPLFIPRRTKLILVLHDLILFERFNVPKVRERVKNEIRRFLIPKGVARAHTVLTVSAYSKQRIEGRFPLAHVHTIPCSISPSWFVEGNGNALDERENCILAVTSSAPHKNASRALASYAEFVATVDRAAAPRLRMVGLSDSAAVFRRRAADLEIGDLVDIEPYLTEGQLQELYRRSRAVFVPSLMEGFGIPVLEAMASGTPVIAANTSSLPEVGGLAAAYFNPSDTTDMAATLKQVLGDPARQQKMIDLGFIRARRFHPEAVGRQVQAFWDGLSCTYPEQISPKILSFRQEAPP